MTQGAFGPISQRGRLRHILTQNLAEKVSSWGDQLLANIQLFLDIEIRY